MDTTHLVALQDGLRHERVRLNAAKTEGERALRSVWVAQYERQIADEMRFLGIPETVETELSAEELFAELQNNS